MFDDQHSPVAQKSFNKTLPSTKVFADSDVQASFNRSMPAGGLAAAKRTRDELPSTAPSAAASSVARSDDEPDEISVPIVGNWTTQPNKENQSINHSNRQTSTRQPPADQHLPSPPAMLSQRHTGSRRATAAPREHDDFEDSASKNFGNVRNQGGFSSAALFELQVQNLIASQQVQLAVTTSAPMGECLTGRCSMKTATLTLGPDS